MFSRAERQYLGILARSHRDGTDPDVALTALFPNPVYRRKLLWGIRRKAQRTAADLSLYAVAARAEVRVLPRAPAPEAPAIPLAEDPLVTFLRYLATVVGPRPALTKGSGKAAPARGRNKEER